MEELCPPVKLKEKAFRKVYKGKGKAVEEGSIASEWVRRQSEESLRGFDSVGKSVGGGRKAQRQESQRARSHLFTNDVFKTSPPPRPLPDPVPRMRPILPSRFAH